METTQLFQITTPSSCAGFVLAGGWRITAYAPILGYLRNWSFGRIQRYCRTKHYTLTEVHPAQQENTP